MVNNVVITKYLCARNCRYCHIIIVIITYISFFPAEVIIGFMPDAVSAAESDGVLNFTVSVLSGELAVEVVVEFYTGDADALGNDYKHGLKPTLFNAHLLLQPPRTTRRQ